MSKELENIEKSVLSVYMSDPEMAKEELSAAGYNVASMTGEGLSMIKQLQFKQTVVHSKTHLLNLYEKAKSLLLKRVILDKEEALVILSQLQVKVQYRNISNFSEEELNEILKDVDLVKLIEELEKK